ncbi:MAG: Fe2+-dependent dioxygenase [Xanthobacteraceae bacterium]|nr:Fe2+-dependent dioxygenase [Xanthobacteraceae bacterium]QYK45840.1 MAG: Fe2+-dependent dioxygenase [Xanthobacteraceae bacterium]
MQLAIANVLSAEEAAEVRAALANVRFLDGRATAGFAAREVKDNRQADSLDRNVKAIQQMTGDRIAANELFSLAARPKQITPVVFSKYEQGMRYGSHVDDALMRGMRSDVSFTLFLSPMESYEGGELVIETASGEDAIKLEAGSMVVYPATTLHRVNEVTRGERLAAVGWVRSFIRDAAKRELLFDLDTARKRLFARDGKSEDYDLLSKSSANLLRMWAED